MQPDGDADESESLEVYTTTRSSARVIKQVQIRLRNTWQHDAEFFTKFFPVDDYVHKTFRQSRKGLYNGKRWSRIPLNPKVVSNLYTPINNLINNVICAFGLQEDKTQKDNQRSCRRSLNTSITRVYPDLEYPIWPPLLLTGSGKYFISTEETCPMKHYALGISAVEVRLENQDATVARDRVAAHTLQLFTYQNNRRYAFGLVISQITLTVYLFDHSGVVSSPSLDYHANPEQFCAIIAGLASTHAERLGLDTTMYWDNGWVTAQTKEVVGKNRSKEIKYNLLALLYYVPDILGRNTICFAAFENSDPKTRYVIKESWVACEDLEGKESEASLISHARSLGVTKGIPVLRHSEEIRIKADTGHDRLDTILNNRHDCSGDHANIERIHARLVMTPYGQPLHWFSNRKELLLAYHDALQAHRSLHNIAGILHRDIKPANILINRRGGEGDRGILIDYDHAIRVADRSPCSAKKEIGTYFFMSRRVLTGNEPHTYLDDLESFYYVLLFIAFAYNGPGSPKKDLPSPLNQWDDSIASTLKAGFIVGRFRLKTDPWLGQPFQTLIERLHLVFRDILMRGMLSDDNGEPPPVVDGTEVCDRMLSFVCEAIDDLNREETASNQTISVSRDSEIISPSDGAKQSREESLDPLLWMKRRRSKTLGRKTLTTVAANRSRRSGVNY